MSRCTAMKNLTIKLSDLISALFASIGLGSPPPRRAPRRLEVRRELGDLDLLEMLTGEVAMASRCGIRRSA